MSGGETVKRLAPSSWPGVGVWAVILVVFATQPVAATRFTASAIWGTGTWIGYTAFADCEDQPPYEWMQPKEWPAAVGPASVELEAGRP